MTDGALFLIIVFFSFFVIGVHRIRLAFMFGYLVGVFCILYALLLGVRVPFIG